ncbi:late embryogenesis abundant protein At5g17165-like [Rutidosis leptorrhynchoides]|uniref:late embryogenesis abundant protein At5g17165-like n=1 Tax=Rutidosis leptorrhynchoides TaxID=125765 RepID=UPI003A9A4821
MAGLFVGGFCKQREREGEGRKASLVTQLLTKSEKIKTYVWFLGKQINRWKVFIQSRRAAHSSAYDKNPEEHVRPSIVPDHVIEAESDKYWAPHPKTGVFSPVADPPAGGEAVVANGGDSLALEEKAWFRPTSLEDFEKPHHHHA